MRRPMRTLTLLLLIAALAAPTAAWAQTVAPAQQEERAPTRTFEITLIRATEGPPEMPALKDGDAVEALTDLMEVLQYTAFELIDSGRVITGAQARLRLGEAGAFEVYLQMDWRRSSGQISIDHFELDQRAVLLDGEWVYTEPESLLATSFGIRPGETIVVGTSRVKFKDEAIIVLVKALD